MAAIPSEESAHPKRGVEKKLSPPWNLTNHHSDPHLLTSCLCAGSETHTRRASAADVRAITARLQSGLTQGGCGIGLGIAYTSGANHEEVYRLFQLGAEWDAPLFIHSRGAMQDLTDFHEIFANAAATGTCYCVHPTQYLLLTA